MFNGINHERLALPSLGGGATYTLYNTPFDVIAGICSVSWHCVSLPVMLEKSVKSQGG
jgi:hypothetical protein